MITSIDSMMRCNVTLEIQELCDLILISIDECVARRCALALALAAMAKKQFSIDALLFPGRLTRPRRLSLQQPAPNNTTPYRHVIMADDDGDVPMV